MIPPMMERELIEEIPQEGPFDLEIAKQLFEAKIKKMRIKSRKQQEEIEKWKEQAETNESQLRRMSTNYGKSKEDKKRLNEEINVLERKFKYAGLRMSHGLPQDEQEIMQKSCVCGSTRQKKPKRRSPNWKVRLRQRMLDISKKLRN